MVHVTTDQFFWVLARVAGLSGKSKGYVSELENGKKEPSMTLLIKLADYFAVSLDELAGRPMDNGGTTAAC